ncbi:Arc family DNA-binding protein [Serratia entomophila]|uniref:Arc family DNA-binding protein n=1 Tax=Serratia entomophila TaxID=42906 RepID=UPI00217CA32C|nr:Arc family DNA-binding protein [Serratia entomophila]CAI0888335.1 Arc-like DNA binding domain [Serratia entomophila]CAI1525990.1 Arc-like DNA binding domain [Serratia entomophila]CAI1575498.1 Arc-like DNA binding domain [Serratia entomophila]CAI1581921.1 Arc-like DNA binding domain [Serratia entomophila]CAI1609853.1 Arc-like DNA binding domain [Serratia entomophila]
MSEISTLTIKIPLELKEKIRAVAADNQLSLSAEVCQRLEDSFAAPAKAEKAAKKPAELHHEEIDNQGIEEEIEQPLSQKELKKLRQLLKTGAKTGKKK